MLLALFFTLLFTIINIFQQNNTKNHFLDQRLIFATDKQINILADAVWLKDNAGLKKQMQIMLATSNIAYITVYNSQQVLGEFGHKPIDDFTTKLIPLMHFHRNHRRQVGLLKIYAKLKAGDKRSLVSFWSILLSNGVKMFFLAAAILWLFHYKTIQNLRRLFQHMTVKNRKVLKDIGFEQKYDETRSGLECDLLTNSVNDMRLALVALKSEIRRDKGVQTSIGQQLSDGLVSLDVNLNIIDLNTAAEILFDYKDDELKGEQLRTLFSDKHYSDVTLAIKNHQKLNLGRVIDDNERMFTIQKKAGNECLVNLSLIEVSASEKIAWVMVIKDLSDQEAQFDFDHSASLDNLIFPSIKFMAIYNGSLNMIYINKSGIELTGLSADITDNSKHNLDNLLPKDDLMLFNNKIKPALADKNFWRGEHNIRTSKGQIVPVMAEYSGLDSGEKESDVLAVVMFDLSIQKKKDSEIGLHLQQLNRLLQQRSLELESVNQELDSFNYSVSHDLRAPLRAIMGFSRILKEESIENGSTQMQQWAERIETNSQRMSSLIQGLLALARVTRTKLDLKTIDISAISNTVLQRLMSAEPHRDVFVRVEEGMSVMADNPLVEVVMNHLLENAWKYTGHEEHAEIECSSCVKGGGRYFCIRDNGVGFNMKYADKLFGPFQRLHTKEEFPGTGIGLATVQRVISRHGGNIFVEAEVGLGASFYFRFSDSIAAKVDNVPEEA